MIKSIISFSILIFSICLFSMKASSAQSDINVRIDSPRGQLNTYVYLSKKNISTLLLRTPYLELDSYSSLISFWKKEGFNVVIQSIIGTGQSTGHFEYLSTHEIEDARITIEWISKQYFFNNSLVLFGESYDGFLALAGGLTRHSSIKAIVAGSAPTNILTDSFSSGGMIDYYLLKYYLSLSSDKNYPLHRFKNRIKDFYKRGLEFDKYDDELKKGGFQDWDKIVHEAQSMHFVNRGIYNRLHEIESPILFMAGEYYDQDATDAIHGFHQRKKHFSNPKVQCPSKLTIGSWVHGAQLNSSQLVALNFLNQALSKSLNCRYPHQIEYIANSQFVKKPNKIGENLYPDIMEQLNMTLGSSDIEFGLSYDGSSLYSHGRLQLPSICQPWTYISPGLQRPYLTIPILEDIKLFGSITAQQTVLSEIDQIVDLSLEVLIHQKDKGWHSLDDQYNMYRTRVRTSLTGDTPTPVHFETPFLSMELKKGDELIISFQRPHEALSYCYDNNMYWLMNKEHELTIQIPSLSF